MMKSYRALGLCVLVAAKVLFRADASPESESLRLSAPNFTSQALTLRLAEGFASPFSGQAGITSKGRTSSERTRGIPRRRILSGLGLLFLQSQAVVPVIAAEPGNARQVKRFLEGPWLDFIFGVEHRNTSEGREALDKAILKVLEASRKLPDIAQKMVEVFTTNLDVTLDPKTGNFNNCGRLWSQFNEEILIPAKFYGLFQVVKWNGQWVFSTAIYSQQKPPSGFSANLSEESGAVEVLYLQRAIPGLSPFVVGLVWCPPLDNRALVFLDEVDREVERIQRTLQRRSYYDDHTLETQPFLIPLRGPIDPWIREAFQDRFSIKPPIAKDTARKLLRMLLRRVEIERGWGKTKPLDEVKTAALLGIAEDLPGQSDPNSAVQVVFSEAGSVLEQLLSLDYLPLWVADLSRRLILSAKNVDLKYRDHRALRFVFSQLAGEGKIVDGSDPSAVVRVVKQFKLLSDEERKKLLEKIMTPLKNLIRSAA